MSAEINRQLGDTSVYVSPECSAQLASFEASTQIPLTELTCGGPCFLAERKMGRALFGVPLNAPEGHVSDQAIQNYLERSCPFTLPVAEVEGAVPESAPVAPLQLAAAPAV